MNDRAIELERLKRVAQAVIDRRALTNVRVDVSDAVEYTANRLVIDLRKDLLARRLGVIEYEFPATPWEHLKLRYAPRWFKRRYPVRYTYDVRTAYATFPEAQVVYPRELGATYIELLEGS